MISVYDIMTVLAARRLTPARNLCSLITPVSHKRGTQRRTKCRYLRRDKPHRDVETTAIAAAWQKRANAKNYSRVPHQRGQEPLLAPFQTELQLTSTAEFLPPLLFRIVTGAPLKKCCEMEYRGATLNAFSRVRSILPIR